MSSNTAQQFCSVFQLNCVLIITSLSYLQLLVTGHSYLMRLVDGTVFHEVFETNQTDHSLLKNVKTCKIHGTVWSCYWQLISWMSVHTHDLWFFPCDVNAVFPIFFFFYVYKAKNLKLKTVDKSISTEPGDQANM